MFLIGALLMKSSVLEKVVLPSKYVCKKKVKSLRNFARLLCIFLCNFALISIISFLYQIFFEKNNHYVYFYVEGKTAQSYTYIN